MYEMIAIILYNKSFYFILIASLHPPPPRGSLHPPPPRGSLLYNNALAVI